MPKIKNKFGFILPPGERFTGASAVNRDIYNYLKDKVDITPIYPDTDYFYQIHIVGSLLNYFSNYKVAGNYEYVMGTSFATLPFIKDTKVIQHFHSIDTASYMAVLDSIKNHNTLENKVMNKWVNYLNDVFEEKIDQIISRMDISNATEKFCAQNSQVIIAVSPSVKEQLEKIFSIDPKKINVILNGIPDYWFAKSKNEFTLEPKILFPSRINYTAYTFLEKGQDRALEILSNINLPKKVYVNFGTMKEELRQKYKDVIKINARSEVIEGLNREQLQDQYSPGDFFLSTSRTEACQLTLIEAMASKAVPITYGIGIAPFIIKNGVNGYLVKTPKEAVEIINKLSKDHKKRKEIGNNAFKTAKDNFTFDNMIDQYRKILESIIK